MTRELRKRSFYAHDRDLVFCHPETGNPLDRSKLVRRFKDALKRATRAIAAGSSSTSTPRGREKLDECIDAGAHREREMLSALATSEKGQLDKLLAALEAEVGGP